MRADATTLRTVRVAPLLLASLLLLTPAGCGPATQPEAGPGEPLSIDLAARLDVAQVRTPPGRVDLGVDGVPDMLTSGWHAFEADGNGGGHRWTRRRDAVVEVPVVTPEDLTLAIGVVPVQELLRKHPHSPTQSLMVLWNGEELGSFELPIDGTTIEVSIPASLQRVGPNRLELLPNYWLVPRWNLVGPDGRYLGLRVDSLEFRPAAAGRATAGEGAAARAETAVARDAAILQKPGSVMTWYFMLPEGARLRGDASLVGKTPTPGVVVVSLLDAEGRATTLVGGDGRPLPAGVRLGIDVDLSSFAGQMVGLSFAFEAEAPSGLRLRWQDLRIDGFGATEAPAPEISRGRYNVFVVLMDSLRSDHIEPYGGERAATPSMQRLADQGVTFLNARSNSAWTRPSVVSMFTSIYPSSHGIAALDEKLAGDLPYLPEILSRNGYATVGVSSTVVISPPFGMARGFDELHLHWNRRRKHAAAADFSPESEARYVWDHYLAPVVDRADERPFFVYLHEIDPHSPYDPPSPYREMYGSGQRFNYNADHQTDGLVATNPLWVEDSDIEYLRSRYMGEISFMDRYLGWMLDALAQRGLADRTLVILVSDHGEEFWDHRALGHGTTVYEELLRVPLILSLPGVLPQGRRPQVDAELVDVGATVLDLLDIPRAKEMQGRSLLRFIAGPEELRPAWVAVGESVNRGHHGLQFGPWKLIRENTGEGASHQPQYSLFDLRKDPGERVDLWSVKPVVGHTLRQLLDEHLRGATDARGGRVEGIERAMMNEDLRENLRALGYIE